jgi:tRNA modification GTPase
MERFEIENSDTIFALSTPSGKGAIALVRLSGPKIREISKNLIQQSEKLLKNPRMQIYSAILADSNVVDYGLATYFEKDKSYTGEESLEISLHCSNAILKTIFREFRRLELRQAEAGEFSKRAYLNGKLDLVQAEAVLDLINSETEAQSRAARFQLEGKLSKAVNDLGEPLRDLLAEIEANIDFPDEDISPAKSDEWLSVLENVKTVLTEYIKSFSFGKILREGALVVLAGIPNAGKSSLMNTILRDDRVIVTDIAGTTRDAIEEKVDFGGILCRLVDTAGIADGEEREIDKVEVLGIKKSKKLISDADLVIFLIDRGQEMTSQLNLLKEIHTQGKETVVVFSKNDLYSNLKSEISGIDFSVEDKTSLIKLEEKILEKLNSSNTNSQILFTNERQRDCLVKAEEGILKSIQSIKDDLPIEITSFELREALSSLTEIVGSTDIENILGRIFSKFCIGK